MSLLYRALGITALVNEILAAISFYHIRLNWILLAVLAILFGDGAAQLGSPRLTWHFLHPLVSPILEMSFSALAIVLLLICMTRRNTVFRPTAFVVGDGAISRTAGAGQYQEFDLRVTAQFERGGGNTVSIREFPFRWEISDTGAISIETRVGAAGGLDLDMLAPQSGDPSGLWSLIVPRKSLTDGLEDGILYFGLSARPALRLAFPGRRTAAILSVRHAEQLIALRSTFDTLLAQSAAKEAAFFSGVKEKLAQPASQQNAEPAGGTKRSGETIPWENLIDFSR
jgi:hypothetical protein